MPFLDEKNLFPFGIDIENFGRIECLANNENDLKVILNFFSNLNSNYGNG